MPAIIRETVEVGLLTTNDLIGGTVDLEAEVRIEDYPYIETTILGIFDTLDHCLITDKKELCEFSQRHYYINRSYDTLFEHIFYILVYAIFEVFSDNKIPKMKLSVTYNKKTVTKKVKLKDHQMLPEIRPSLEIQKRLQGI